MILQPIKNLICSGHTVCVERDVLCISVLHGKGEAAGTAAKHVVKNEIPFNKINRQKLRNRLQAIGGIVYGDQLPNV